MVENNRDARNTGDKLVKPNQEQEEQPASAENQMTALPTSERER